MTDDTNKPAETKSAIPPTIPMAAADTKTTTPKPAARPRAAKTAAPAAKKPLRKPPTAKATTTAARKAAHEPEPFTAKDSKASKPAKAKKAKLVRDSFTMPDAEYDQIAALKKRCLNAGVSAKKSEILRAAVANLAKLSDSSLVAAVRRLDVIKTGRPAKGPK